VLHKSSEDSKPPTTLKKRKSERRKKGSKRGWLDGEKKEIEEARGEILGKKR